MDMSFKSGLPKEGSFATKACPKNFVLVFIFVRFKAYGEWWAKMQRAYEISTGFGMSLQGVRSCGDYMFSGHTCIVTMLNFFITECKLITCSFLHYHHQKLKKF